MSSSFKLRNLLLLIAITVCLSDGVSAFAGIRQKRLSDENHISGLLGKAGYFVSRPESTDKELDSARDYYLEAIRLSKLIRNPGWYRRCMLEFADYYFVRGEVGKGKAAYFGIIRDYQNEHDRLSEAKTWDRMAKKIPDGTNVNLPDKIRALEHARTLYDSLGYKAQSVAMLKGMAESHIKERKLELAKSELNIVLAQYQKLGNKNLYEVYDSFAKLSRAQIDLHKELYYRLEIIKSMEAVGKTEGIDYSYQKLALVYADLKMFKESLVWSIRALDILKERKVFYDYYGYLSLIIYDFIKDERPEEGLKFLIKASQEVPPLYRSHKVDLQEGFANCYVALKQYRTAEKHYLEMMRLYKLNLASQIPYAQPEEMLLDYIHYFQIMGDFYVLTNRFEKAGFYYNKILEIPASRVRPITLSKIHLMQFRVDSASAKYVSAIRHFEQHKKLDDSLFNITKSNQIGELQFKYETEKKDKELQVKQKNILMLTTKGQLQEVNLKKANTTRNIIGFSALMMLCFAYLGYRIKQKDNTRLQAQQKEINEQNLRLREVLIKQNKLIVEKEWLVKEIHHRVKNNLQIVISLLNTQSRYLDNKQAIEAIGESRHRMQAMSLIHEKLYQSENVTVVNMQTYITELIKYLDESLNRKENLSFEIDVNSIDLVISQAIPVGLILNEAITNAIKYAFPGEEPGLISVCMELLSDSLIRLQVKDNGIGFPQGFDFHKNDSMGAKLMDGLARQIGEKLVVQSENGVLIRVVFNMDKEPVLVRGFQEG